MYHHVKKLMYTVRVDEPDPKCGNMLLEKVGGAMASLRQPCRVSTAMNCHHFRTRSGPQCVPSTTHAENF